MTSKPCTSSSRDHVPRYYRGAGVPMRAIRQFARQVAEQFDPDKIILFGSYAYGKPHADSDVDLMVVMPARNELDRGFKIHWAIRPPFPLNIFVRTPKNMQWRLEEGDSFLREVVAKGKVLYEKAHSRVGSKGRSRFSHRNPKRRKRQATT